MKLTTNKDIARRRNRGRERGKRSGNGAGRKGSKREK